MRITRSNLGSEQDFPTMPTTACGYKQGKQLTYPNNTLTSIQNTRSQLHPNISSAHILFATQPSAYPRAVFPTPLGPQTSVTFPLDTPPKNASSSNTAPGSRFCNAQSKSLNPVEMHRVEDVLRSFRACAAETVGRRSSRVSQDIMREMGTVRTG